MLLEAAVPMAPGWVSIVGAGPGPLDLLTLRALDRLRRAEVVIHDRLIGADILAEIPALALLQRAARCGQHVALLLAVGQGVQMLQPPAPARRALGVAVRAVGGGGGTPLAAALQRAETLALAWARRTGGRARQVLWLITDGRVRQAPPRPALEVCVVVDADDDHPALGQARQWAQRWQAHHVALNDWN
ncbi:SAM-dependent methyltransferase [Tepidimonas sp.]|uniref:SAM-dependent methyltransferase n=1 Tax=Tepidimonas sp. TaxID=2002775 RepID=UPI002FE0C511